MTGWLAAVRLSRRRRRPNKTTHWDRPVIRDWRWTLRVIGHTLIVIGLLMFGFVAYQLWGTGLETARYQNQLENEFEGLIARHSTTTTSTTTTPPPTTKPTRPGAGQPPRTTVATTAPPAAPPTTAAPDDLAPLELGSAVGKIEIPKIGLDFWVVAGVEYDDLKRGIGHYPETPLPGERGNSALAGHRTTWGNPFYHIDEVEAGDEIIITTLDGRFVYRATGQQIVSPSDTWVIATTQPKKATLTLTSCNPRFSSSQRIVISAELDRTGDDPIAEPVRDYAPAVIEETSSTTLPGDTPSSTPRGNDGRGDDVNGGGRDGDQDRPGGNAPGQVRLSNQSTNAFESSWFSDKAAFVDVALWTLVVSLIAALGYLVGWYLKRDWVGFAVAALPFIVTLYFFYQNVNRLLPAAL